MYIPSNLRCHDRGSGSLCAARVDNFVRKAEPDDTKSWMHFECTAEKLHETGYPDQEVTV